MKRYIKSANTLDEMSDVIKSRLLVDGVDRVQIEKINSRYASVKLIYSDGSMSNTFQVRFDNKPTRTNAESTWNPNWTIKDDGSVINELGEVIGWFKLIKNKPQQTSANYQENSLIVDYGTRSIELTEDSGDRVANIVKSSNKR